MRRRAAGFTLVEVLIVLSLVGILMGLSIGFLGSMGRGNSLIDSANRLRDLFAAAANSSVGGERAYVALEPREGGGAVARAFVNRQVFCWACEDLTSASEEVLEKTGGVRVAENDLSSREGKHVRIDSGGAMNLGNRSWLQMRDGFAIRCRIRPDAKGGSMTLFQKGNAYAVRLVPAPAAGSFDVEVEINLEADATGKGGGSHLLRTGFREATEVAEWRGPVLGGRWQDIRIAYDRNLLTIHVDERLRGIRGDKSTRIVLSTEGFKIGGGYSGGFDSLLVSGIFERDEARFEIGQNVVWVDDAGKPKTAGERIHFLNRGLDAREHARPVAIRLMLDEGGVRGAVRTVRVEMSGETFVGSPQG